MHEIAHAVAAGDAFGAVDIATIMKLSRVLMLVFAAIVIAVWWDKNHSEMPADGKRKVSFPWFMLGFIGASIIGTFVPFIGAITPNLVDFAYIVLGMAMAALGINVNFNAIAKKGQKAFLASFITSVVCLPVLCWPESQRCSSNRSFEPDRLGYGRATGFANAMFPRRPTPRFRHSYPLLRFHPSWRHIL